MKKTIKLNELKKIIHNTIKEIKSEKGYWTGLGTDTPVWNRHEPKKRAKDKNMQLATHAQKLWDGATSNDRYNCLKRVLGYDHAEASQFMDTTDDIAELVGWPGTQYVIDYLEEPSNVEDVD